MLPERAAVRSAAPVGARLLPIIEATRGYDVPAVVRLVFTIRALQIDETNYGAFVGFVDAEQASARQHAAGQTAEDPRHG
jgi:hypothetical protein